ncbi:AUGMIN subunit 8-like isoform X2 [Tasmannia lanceolata]
MDVSETEENQRPPLAPSEKNNVVSRKPRTREITSRYKSAFTSPSLSTPTLPRRCPSPNLTRTAITPAPLVSKRAQSAERRRPSTPSSPSRSSAPSSPSRPSTPNYSSSSSSTDMQISSRRLIGGRTPEGLWPSTRSLYVSFQSDTFSLPVTKKERPVTVTHSSDHTLKPSANVAHRQGESLAVQRKVTPERKRTPLRRTNASNQSENSKPVDNSHARVIDEHRWPSRTSGKMSANALTRSMDLTEKPIRTASLPLPGRGVSPIRRMPQSDGLGRGLHKSVSEVAKRVSFDASGRVEYEPVSIDNSNTSLRLSGPPKLGSLRVGGSSISSERASLAARPSRTLSSPLPGLHPPSPSKATLASSPSRAMLSPSRTRPSTPFPSASTVSSRSSSSTSVLSFVADVRKGKKGGSHIEDAHQLRLLYNRYLQWRFVNARADVASSIQKVTAENILCNVWNTTSELRDSVTKKRINLQQLRREMKLNVILNEQMKYLADWILVEREHSSSLSGAIEALEASTLRLPVTGGAKAEIHMVKDAVSSAVDVMQAMGSSICSLLSKVEGMNSLVSELADVAAQERVMLDECGDLLASTVSVQVEESSLRVHLVQLKQAVDKREEPSCK